MGHTINMATQDRLYSPTQDTPNIATQDTLYTATQDTLYTATQDTLYTATLLLVVVNTVFSIFIKIGENVIQRSCKADHREKSDGHLVRYLVHLVLLCLMVDHVVGAADIHTRLAQTWMEENDKGESKSLKQSREGTETEEIEENAEMMNTIFDNHRNMLSAIEMSACFMIIGICSIYFWLHYLLVKMKNTPYLAFMAVVFSPPLLIIVLMLMYFSFGLGYLTTNIIPLDCVFIPRTIWSIFSQKRLGSNIVQKCLNGDCWHETTSGGILWV